MAAEIEGKERTLKDVFGGEYAFRIPPYQRPYRWGTGHTDDLLEDLLLAAGSPDDDAVDDMNPYFLGSVVLVKKKHDADAEVLDGQQRLTTLALLIACLRDLSQDVKFKAGLTKYLYDPGNPVEGTSDHYRLRVRDDDRAYFEANVLKPDGLSKLKAAPAKTESQRNLRFNGLRLHEELSKLDEALRTRLAQFIAKRCFLVVVSTQDFDSAYRIFSVLNDRGLDLSLTDILKADVIGAIADGATKKEYTGKWEGMEEALGVDAFEALFSHLRMIRLKTKLRGKLIDDFRKAVKPASAPTDFVDNVLLTYGEVLCEISARSLVFADETPYDAEISVLLSSLLRVDHGEWQPPALVLVQKHRDDAKKTRDLLAALEAMAASFMILRVRRGERIKRYADVIKGLEVGADLLAAGSALQLTAQEKQDTLTTLDGDVYNSRAAKLILLRLDSILSGAGASYQHGLISIEHVLPQSPKAGSHWEADFPGAEHGSRVHRLGNLVLLARKKNSSASNFDFATKKKKYFSGPGGVSPFALTTQVLAEAEWKPATVDKRQAELLAALKAAWGL